MFDLIYPPTPAPRLPRPTYTHPGMPPVGAGELLPVIEPNGLVVGQAARAWCHGGSHLLHPVVHLHLIDREGRIYLQKRADTKDLLPGYWDTAVGGHVSYGETIHEALYRETEEELGLTAFNPVFLEAYRWETALDNEFVCVFAAVGHPEVTPDPAEVSEGRWWTPDEIAAARDRDILTPNFAEEFFRIRDQLVALL